MPELPDLTQPHLWIFLWSTLFAVKELFSNAFSRKRTTFFTIMPFARNVIRPFYEALTLSSQTVNHKADNEAIKYEGQKSEVIIRSLT